MSNANSSDPMDFLRNLWGSNGFSLPGMVAPTLDTDELEKQIRDLKTVEGWLRTNLSMLSMTIQNLEMQRTTLSAMKTMSQMYADQAAGNAAPNGAATGAATAGNDALAQAAMWPWNMMQQMQESMQNAGSEATKPAAAAARPATPPGATEAAAEARGGAAKRKKTG